MNNPMNPPMNPLIKPLIPLFKQFATTSDGKGIKRKFIRKLMIKPIIPPIIPALIISFMLLIETTTEPSLSKVHMNIVDEYSFF